MRCPSKLQPAMRCAWVLAGVCCGMACAAQDAPKQAVIDQQTLQGLLARIDRLEARVQELEGNKAAADLSTAASAMAQPPASAEPSATVVVEAAPAPGSIKPKTTEESSEAASEQSQSESPMERMDVSKTLLRIRGFGDVSLHGDTHPGDTTSFSLGQLDLFVTSDISDRFRFLSEIVFEAGPDNVYGVSHGEKNAFGVDIERYLIQYSWNDYLNLSLGRGHTAIGYYNTAYHHSSWLQTATGRPFLFDFEDRGGILPVHMIGAELSGQLRSGDWGLHYALAVGNGRASRDPLDENPVQNVTDDQNHKAYNVAVFSRPNAVHGLQTGLSLYHDVLHPQDQPRIAEWIPAWHAVLIRPRYEWLNEALLDTHRLQGSGKTFHTPGFYTQLSREWRSYRPYFRYQYVNVADKEPVFPEVGLRHGPSAGLRYDATESLALKIQYDYTMLRRQAAVNGVAMQVGFTF